MFCAVDVDYRVDTVVAAAVGFTAWDDAAPAWEDVLTSTAPPVAYQPGQFFERELPYLLELLARRPMPEVIVVDGFVWLGPGQPGLGAHLHTSLTAATAVVGVAKRPYRGTSVGEPVLRGSSETPLLVSAVGMPVEEAVAGVRRMHGPHRVPTLLKRVDRLSREG